MKWIGISGTWKITTPEVERDVREAVRTVMERGDGIINGGALGVDYFAMNEALMHDPAAARMRVLLPVTLPRYIAHLRTRQSDEAVAALPVDELISLLERVAATNPDAILGDLQNTVCDRETYFKRNTDVVNASDELYAFAVNGSAGTMDTVGKARAARKPVVLKEYSIPV